MRLNRESIAIDWNLLGMTLLVCLLALLANEFPIQIGAAFLAIAFLRDLRRRKG